VVQAGIIIALARLLTPEEFGTVALLSLFLGIATVLADGGFSTALIQRQDATHVDESSVFWVTLAVGTLLSATIFLLAPVLATFYDSAVLEPLTRLMSLGVLLSALGAVPHALVMKRLGFRTLLVVGLVGTGSSGVVALLLAWQDHGVWALAGQYVTLAVVTTAMLWILSGWRPGLVFSADSARTLFGFGGYMLASGLLDASFNRLYTVLIGRWYGVRELGFYVRAETTQQVPATVLSSIASRVALPVFSEAAADPARLRRGARLSLRGLMLINAPMMLGLAAVADPLVEAVFGSVWLPAVPLLQVLCLAGLLWPLHVINLTLLAAQGHARLVFRLEVVKQTIGLALVLIGALSGPLGIAWAMVAGGLVAVAVNAFYTKHFVRYGLVAQLADVGPTLAVSAVMAAVVAVAARSWDPTPIVELLALSGLGAVVFVGLAFAVRLATLHDMVALLRRQPAT
jgi:O-antigen/teichoic acid export membrane protein